MSIRSSLVLIPLALALAAAPAAADAAPVSVAGQAAPVSVAGQAAPAAVPTVPTVRTAPSGDPDRAIALARRLLPDRGKLRDLLLVHPGYQSSTPSVRVIDGSVYQCGPTAFDDWVASSLRQFTKADFEVLDRYAALDLPTYEALLLGTAGDPRFALRADAKVLTKTFRELRRFWNIRSDDIQLLAMHGDMLLDRARVARVYRVAFGVPAADAEKLAAELVDYLSAPRFDGGNHPIFTLNAFAWSFDGEIPGIGRVAPRIVMGDGILQAYREMGYGDVAPQTVLAHEYAHHVQFALDMFDSPDAGTAEGTRRTELHADASAAYFLSHPRGASMQWKRVRQFLAVFYVIGDCHFDNPNHHGTPAQRMRAADWGYQQQEQARPRGHVLTAQEFLRRYDAALPGLVAPDRQG